MAVHIIYFDESGNSGVNLRDPQQPFFVLAALIVPEDTWVGLEHDLMVAVDAVFPPPRAEDFEIHASDLRNGGRIFRGVPVSTRVKLRDSWLSIAKRHGVRLVYRAINKARFARWVQDTFGSGVRLNPHVVAFPLVARVVDDHLQSCRGSPLGMFVFDENREVVRDVEKSLRILRGIGGRVRLTRIIEKGFFIDSAKSLLLQLCDICAYSARKQAEHEAGAPLKPIDVGGVEGIAPLTHHGNEGWPDVIAWITDQQKKGAARE